jgi:hypothetical protein
VPILVLEDGVQRELELLGQTDQGDIGVEPAVRGEGRPWEGAGDVRPREVDREAGHNLPLLLDLDRDRRQVSPEHPAGDSKQVGVTDRSSGGAIEPALDELC